jgi:cytochrome c oxidase subunit 3
MEFIITNSKAFKQQHPFHLVTRSPWPFMISFVMLGFAQTLVGYFHKFSGSILQNHFFLLFLACFSFAWFCDIIEESTFEGHHTFKVRQGLKLGMLLFIVSEIMLFFSLFWAFFHSSISPTPWIGCIFPPDDVFPVYAWGLPLTNTLLLISSGLTITWSHKSMLLGNFKETIYGLILTLALGGVFLFFQYLEYRSALLSINDGVFGSCFYLTTGLHGLHVFAGAMYLLVCLIRAPLRHFTKRVHFGYEAAIWYWHFVDVVWILVFLFIYWWGGNGKDYVKIFFFD